MGLLNDLVIEGTETYSDETRNYYKEACRSQMGSMLNRSSDGGRSLDDFIYDGFYQKLEIIYSSQADG